MASKSNTVSAVRCTASRLTENKCNICARKSARTVRAVSVTHTHTHTLKHTKTNRRRCTPFVALWPTNNAPVCARVREHAWRLRSTSCLRRRHRHAAATTASESALVVLNGRRVKVAAMAPVVAFRSKCGALLRPAKPLHGEFHSSCTKKQTAVSHSVQSTVA